MQYTKKATRIQDNIKNLLMFLYTSSKQLEIKTKSNNVKVATKCMALEMTLTIYM